MNYILLNKVEENEIANYMPSDKKLKDMACFFQNFADSTRLKIIFSTFSPAHFYRNRRKLQESSTSIPHILPR